MWKAKSGASIWPDVFLILILALLPLLFFWRLVTPNPADRQQIAAGDFTEQYFPLRAFTAQQWVSGHLPLWNPYLFGGQPALADIQSGALYPPHVIQALLLGWGGPLLGREIDAFSDSVLEGVKTKFFMSDFIGGRILDLQYARHLVGLWPRLDDHSLCAGYLWIVRCVRLYQLQELVSSGVVLLCHFLTPPR